MSHALEQTTLLHQAATRGEALRIFLALLDRHAERIAKTKARVEDIYRFVTPDRPVVDFDVSGFNHCGGAWVQSAQDGLLDGQMQQIAFRLESLPEADFVPCMSPGTMGSEFIPLMFGAEFDYPADGGAVPKGYLLQSLADVARLPEVDIRETPQGRAVLENTRFLYELTEGKVNIVYPQMQGPITNTVRLMEQMEVLMACAEDPEGMAHFALTVWRPAIQVMQEMRAIVGADSGVLRPRGRFYQPAWVQGLLVDDYISVIAPEQYLAITAEAYRRTVETMGAIFLHTCGPVCQCVPALIASPGLVGFEVVFLRGQRKTTEDLRGLKAQLQGKVVLNSVQLPFGETVHDEENLTAEWLAGMTDGGGFMLNATGTADEGRGLLERLGII